MAKVKARDSVLECAGPPVLSSVVRSAKSSRGLEHSKTLPRLRDVPGARQWDHCSLAFTEGIETQTR